jgi:hypothetical protein
MKTFVVGVMAGLLTLVMVGLGGQVAQARLLGNPVPYFTKDSMDVGLGLSTVSKNYKVTVPQVCAGTFCVGGGTATGSDTDSHTTVFLDYGISDKGVIRGELGSASFGAGSASGTEIGINYRQSFGSKALTGGKTLTWGGLAGVESGSISGDNFGSSLTGSYTEYQVAFGASIAINKMLNAYGAGVFDNFDGSMSGNGYKFKFSSADPIGVYGGADYAVTPEFRVGGEYHLIFEQGWAIYGLYKF